MRVTKESVGRAIRVLCQEMRAPRPGEWKGHWSVAMDEAWIENCLKPAFIRALFEIEDVEPCYGFKLPL